MIKNKLYQKLFLSERYFTIALRKKNKNYTEVFDTESKFEYVIKAEPKKWCADPVLVDDNDKTYLFFESVKGHKGRIEVAEVKDDLSLSETAVLLEDECHYSYPFVFSSGKDWFMIPESSASSQVRLYYSTQFPYKWSQPQTILEGEYVDTTVFNCGSDKILLTFELVKNSEMVIPKAFLFELNERKASLKPLKFERFDSLKVRGAGGAFSINGNVIRPAQISRENIYGDGLVFYKCYLSGEDYYEEKISEIRDSDIKADGIWFDGLHTYSSSEKFEAVDLRCRKFDLFKLIKRFI